MGGYFFGRNQHGVEPLHTADTFAALLGKTGILKSERRLARKSFARSLLSFGWRPHEVKGK